MRKTWKNFKKNKLNKLVSIAGATLANINKITSHSITLNKVIVRTVDAEEN